MKIKRHRSVFLRRSSGILAAIAGLTASAHADTFTTEGGTEVRWSAGTSVGAGWRASNADPALVSVGNGGLAGTVNDDGNLNFKKGQAISSTVNLIGEIDVRKDRLGFFARAKGWYDHTLSNKGVVHGSYANGFSPGAKLDDSDFDRLSRFNGVEVLDAYGRAEVDLPGNRALSLRLGRQVVNWGESLFVPGINQYNAFDLTAAHRPGAQVKEILRPIPQAFVSTSLAEGVGFEAFYQLGRAKTVLDGCGTYWSPADILNCSKEGTLVGAGPFTDQQMYAGIPALGGLNMRMGLAPERKADTAGQFGTALRMRSDSLDTDFGLYFAQYNTRVPNLSAVTSPTAIPGSIWGMAIPGVSRPMQLQLDYSAKKIKVLGLSASTVLGGWSVSSELSHSTGVPVQINGVDLLNGIVGGIGPQGALAATPANTYVRGYDKKSKTQLQVSTLQVLPRVLGAQSLTVAGELAMQHWSGIKDPSSGGARYGRPFVYGSGPVALPGVGDICAGGVPAAGIAPLNANPSYCENKGFATPFAVGYRLLLEATYSDVFAGVNVKPRLFFSHDVKGWSADGLFSQGRRTVSPGVRLEYRGQYYLDMAYARFARAKYDEMHDRDFYTLVAGVQF